MATIHVLLFFLSATFCNALERQNLNGLWAVEGPEISIGQIAVPGGIFSDLMGRDVLDNVFFGYGDNISSWVGEADWTYSTTFTVDEALLARRVISLVFEGIDTFATVSINGVEVGTTENMFRRYVFDVKDQLQAGDNLISLNFASSVTKSADLAADPSNTYVVPPECPAPQSHGICHANRIRKMQSSFSWDWGPAFASTGIWKDVYLQAFDDAVIDYVVATPSKDPDTDTWTLTITTYFDGGDIESISGSIMTTLQTEEATIEATIINAEINKNEYSELSVTTTLEIESGYINVWWPNGYGTHDVYNLTVNFVGDNEQDEKTVRVGFRTIELVQDEIDGGLTFYFKVNDVPIFAKGANEIPINILPELGQDQNLIRGVLQSAADVHMNMLRVWGGGAYESDYFYDLTDEYGILIWQDFMFACAMYPTDDAFLSNVREEVRHQLKRLGSHASIAIWAGNNENEAALRQNWYGTAINFTVYKDDYIKLYVDVIQDEVHRILPGVPFLTSSPTNGLRTDQEDHVAQDPQAWEYGDVHYYNYGSDSWNVAIFPIPRFASEYGYQSMPSVESWETATTSLDDLRPDSDFLMYRQHHPGGNTENINLINIQMQLPASSSPNYVKAFIYFSQILQAQSIKTETEHYRSYKGRYDDNGWGNTMGALYWQLNDVWVAPTWSGRDFTGRWKMLHYFAHEFYNPMIVTGRLTTNNNLEIYAIFDGLQVPDVSVKAVVYIYSWDSLTPSISIEIPLTLDPLASVLVLTMNAEGALIVGGCGLTTPKRNCFFHLNLMDQDYNLLAPTNYVFPEKLKSSSLANAHVEIASVTPTDDLGKDFDIEVTTDAVALFVWLDSHRFIGRFSRNGYLQVSASVIVHFTAEETVDLEILTNTLTVTHLRDPAYL